MVLADGVSVCLSVCLSICKKGKESRFI